LSHFDVENGYCSILLSSYFLSSGALASSVVLLSNSIISLALHITIILISHFISRFPLPPLPLLKTGQVHFDTAYDMGTTDQKPSFNMLQDAKDHFVFANSAYFSRKEIEEALREKGYYVLYVCAYTR